MRWKGGERQKKSWMSCAVFWTNTRGEADEQLSELDFAGSFADARLDVIALPVARCGAGGAVCRGGSGLPERVGTLCAGGGSARIDAGVAGCHFFVVSRTSWARRPNSAGRNPY